MSQDPHNYKAFRQRLDATLRQRDPAALRLFLVQEGQWDEHATPDTDAAMWMMIATSKALADQHEEARRWLLAHGHENEAAAIFGGRGSGGLARPATYRAPSSAPRTQHPQQSARTPGAARPSNQRRSGAHGPATSHSESERHDQRS